MDNVLLFFALKYFGNWESIYSALEQKEKISHEDLLSVQSKIDCNFITIINPLYPINLKNSHKPPFVLFVSGNLNLLDNYHQIIGVSGGEKFDDYGQRITKKLVDELVLENRIILTGDNFGLEKLIIQNTFNQKGRLIIVTKKGLKNYLLENQEILKQWQSKIEILIISEIYESNHTNYEVNEYYSRLKVGLMKGLLFTQISVNDLEYKMTNYILNDGKDIFAMPTMIDSKYNGCNFLIKQGAKLIESVKDILNEI